MSNSIENFESLLLCSAKFLGKKRIYEFHEYEYVEICTLNIELAKLVSKEKIRFTTYVHQLEYR